VAHSVQTDWEVVPQLVLNGGCADRSASNEHAMTMTLSPWWRSADEATTRPTWRVVVRVHLRYKEVVQLTWESL